MMILSMEMDRRLERENEGLLEEMFSCIWILIWLGMLDSKC